MSDLISRGDAINLLCILHIDNVTVNGKRVTEYIRELPIAYDVEKVVEELDSAENYYYDDGFDEEGDLILVKSIRQDVAIDIVRKGGVE